jgi:hypothetical protein
MAAPGDKPHDSPTDPDDINNRLAEIAAELASEARFKEPSAAERARMAAGHLRPGPAAGSNPVRRWRSRRPTATRRVAQPTEPTLDRGYATHSARAGTARSLMVVLVMLIVLIGVSVGLHSLLHRTTPASSPPPPAPSTTAATTPPASSATLSPGDPFAGSQAAGWANGAAGIDLPAAQAVGPFTAVQVGSAYKTVKQLLVAGNLNVPTLEGHAPTAFADLLTKSERSWFLSHLTKPVTGKGQKPWRTRLWVTSFAPGSAVLADEAVRVHGGPMTASVASYEGRTALKIVADYIYVYAIERPGLTSTLMREVVQGVETIMFATWDDPGGSLEPNVANVQLSQAPAQCGIDDGFVHPAFPATGPGTVSPSGAPRNPYQLDPNAPKGCFSVTGA